MARHPESLGHEVIVADPKLRTDVRDLLAEHQDRQARRDTDGGVSAWSIPFRAPSVRCEATRESPACGTRGTGSDEDTIDPDSQITCEARWLRVAGSESHLVAKRIKTLDISDTLATELMPVFTILAPINEQIAVADHELARLCEEDQTVALLATSPAIGPVTAAAVVSTVDDMTRFQVGASV